MRCEVRGRELVACESGTLSSDRPGQASVAIVDNVPSGTRVHAPVGEGEGYALTCTTGETSDTELSLGSLKCAQYTALSRSKLWWMSASAGGTEVSSIPVETQFLLVEADAGGIYACMIPIARENFRATLRGGKGGELVLALSTGAQEVQRSAWESCVVIAACVNPFRAIEQAVAAAEHVCSDPGFRRRHRKQAPAAVDRFGWCTWDAFYHDVSPKNIVRGLESFRAGGVSPQWLVIDDGWQTVAPSEGRGSVATASGRPSPFAKLADFVIDVLPNTVKDFFVRRLPFIAEGFISASGQPHFTYRLASVRANEKFSQKSKPDAESSVFAEEGAGGLKAFISQLKTDHGVSFVYCWHAITGYWGGLSDCAEGMRKYAPQVTTWSLPDTMVQAQPTLRHDPLTVNGVGLARAGPRELYKDMHGYLQGCGVDGVKVDVQASVAPHGASLGGSTTLARQYHSALEDSIEEHFGGQCIGCMSHTTDDLLCYYNTPVCRASDDFYPLEDASHGAHLMAVAFNSLLIGEIAIPDWDMFHSQHKFGSLHAACRAVGGGPVYVSDAPGRHDFGLLKQLVTPSGEILRAKHHGRPTRDCLFRDVLGDGQTVLKVWNHNAVGGVLGCFNVQGARWDKHKQKYYPGAKPEPLKFSLSPSDVELSECTPASASQPASQSSCNFALFSYRTGQVARCGQTERLERVLEPMEWDVFTVVQLHEQGPAGVAFAPLGLAGMINGAAALRAVDVASASGAVRASVALGPEAMAGTLMMYCSKPPSACHVAGVELAFDHNPHTCITVAALPAVRSEPLIVDFTWTAA